MAKKHKHEQSESVSSGSAVMHEAEYKTIKHDLIKVLYLNVIYLGALLVLYYTNSKTHYLEQIFSKVFHF